MNSLDRRRIATVGAVVLTLGALAIVAPEIYTGTFSDAGTFLRVALVGAVLFGWATAVRRFVPNELAANTMALAPVLVAAAIFVWPYVRPATEVDEAFPPVAGATTTTTTAATTAATQPVTTPTTTTTTTTTAPPISAPIPGSRIEATETTTAPTTQPTATTTTATTAPPTTAPPTTVPPTTVPPTTVPPAPVELRRAGFQGLTGHRGSGDAVLYDLGAGPRLLRFEDVDIGSGPALDVYVVPGADRRSLGDAIFVAPLTAERGNQNYDVPDGVDLSDGTWTVLVWCETFDVEVANATL